MKHIKLFESFINEDSLMQRKWTTAFSVDGGKTWKEKVEPKDLNGFKLEMVQWKKEVDTPAWYEFGSSTIIKLWADETILVNTKNPNQKLKIIDDDEEGIRSYPEITFLQSEIKKPEGIKPYSEEEVKLLRKRQNSLYGQFKAIVQKNKFYNHDELNKLLLPFDITTIRLIMPDGKIYKAGVKTGMVFAYEKNAKKVDGYANGREVKINA